jgi:hypothetical protein
MSTRNLESGSAVIRIRIGSGVKWVSGSGSGSLSGSGSEQSKIVPIKGKNVFLLAEGFS